MFILFSPLQQCLHERSLASVISTVPVFHKLICMCTDRAKLSIDICHSVLRQQALCLLFRTHRLALLLLLLLVLCDTTTHMDIRNPPLGHGLSIQYYNTTTIPKQSITNNSECTVVHTQQSPTHRSAHINSSRRSYETRHHP